MRFLSFGGLFPASILLLTAVGGANALTPPVKRVLSGARLHVVPGSDALSQAQAWRARRPADAAMMERIAEQPVATWLGDWNRDVRGDVDRTVSAAARAGALPVLVAYNIPKRDCQGFSGGGASSAKAYRSWIQRLATGLGGRPAVVLVEPDAVAAMDCLSKGEQKERLALIREAVTRLKAAGATVYVDAGHARWIAPEEMGRRLEGAGIAEADGFALNVSNFISTEINVAYGERLSTRTGGKRFVLDTSRNGRGGTGEWCNPRGQALGSFPTTATGHPLVDAYLWVKRPGQSDGTCNGGPRAGQWWPEYALELARNQPRALALGR